MTKPGFRAPQASIGEPRVPKRVSICWVRVTTVPSPCARTSQVLRRERTSVAFRVMLDVPSVARSLGPPYRPNAPPRTRWRGRAHLPC